MSHPSRIAIVGAGPGGLTLARILLLNGIEAIVFERDEHADARTQGGSLDMHVESGQYALECAGLTAEFKRIARYEDQEMRIYDKHGTLLFLNESNAGDRPEVDRGQLRQLLLDSLPAEAIHWSHELATAKLEENGRCELTFRNGHAEAFDLVAGADGAWSRIRPLLSEARPAYSGVMFVEMMFEDADERYPEIAALVGHGMMFALGESKAILGHRDAGSRLTFYAGIRTEIDGFAKGVLDERALLTQFEGWSDDVLQVITRCTQPMVARPINALPVGHRWTHRRGATLIGDSAHLMSPFSGEGANLAMLDAADLGLALANEADWDAAIRAFEEKICSRAEGAAIGAGEALEEVFSADGLAHMLKHMQEHLVS